MTVLARQPMPDRSVTISPPALARADPITKLPVQRSNVRQIRETVASAHAIGLHRISFLAADVSSEAFNRPDGWDPAHVMQVALTVEDLPLLAAELDALEAENSADFASGFIDKGWTCNAMKSVASAFARCYCSRIRRRHDPLR
jgi:hypothetical protein